MTDDYAERQQNMFFAIIRWTNILLVLSVLINSYWFRLDVARTLIQDLLALSVVATGVWCMRLMRRGQMERAVRIYLTMSMMLMALTVLVVNDKFILNGVFGLALYVLIASFLVPSDRSLRWGLVAVAFYLGALSIRVWVLPGGLALGTDSLLALYIFPVATLLAFAFLGRNATGHLNRALSESEAARRELEVGRQALEQAQAALEQANQQLRVELGERLRTEEALRTSLEESDRSQRLLLALNRAAHDMQRARTPEEVYRTVGAALKELGREAGILCLSEDARHLEIAYLTFGTDKVTRLEQLLGFPLLGHRIPLTPGGTYERVLSASEAVLTDGGNQYAAAALPEPQQPLAAESRALLEIERGLLVALGSGEETYGILAVSGTDMDQTEGQAVATFADQAAVALSNVRLLQEVRSWAAELEQRVEERTADLAASEARYRRLFNTNRDALFVLDSEGHALDANPAASRLLGYDQQELASRNLFELGIEAQALSTEEHARLMAQIEQAWQNGLAGYETMLQQRDGGRVPVEVSITPLVYEGQTAALAAVRDISERKQAQAALEASRARMQHLAHQVISAQEQERQRLAGALHDEAGQALTALKISLELIAKDVPQDLFSIRGRLSEAGHLADATLEGIRKMAQDLRPPALDRVGLSPTLETFCREFAQHTQLEIHYQGTELPMLAEPVNTTLYRFLQEALTNVARHADAHQVHVALRSDAESISLSVNDDGRGFETLAPGDGPAGQGMGLPGMRERLQSLDGWLVLESQPGQGTRLTAHIPLDAAHVETEAS